MSVDREYRIRIATSADTSGAQQTAAELDKLGNAQEGAGQKIEVASQVTEKHSGHLREMHRAFHALNGIVPGLGALMQAAFSPVGAAISIGVIALRAFQEHLKKVNEELDKMAEANAKPLTNRLEIMRESVIRNAASMVELGLRISDASRSEHELAKNIDEVISRMRKQGAELQTLGETRGKGELAILENLHQAGLVAEEDYERRRLKIEEELVEKKRKLAEDELQAEINVRKAGGEAAKQSQPEFRRQAESARNQSETAQTESLAARSGMDTAKENLTQAKDAMKEWVKGHTTELGENYARVRAGGAPDAGFSKEQFDKWEKLKRDVEGGQVAADKSLGDVAKKETAATTAKDTFKRASDEAVENAKLVTKSKEEVERKERELTALKQSNHELSGAEHNENQLSRPMGKMATQDLEAAVRTALKFVDTPEMYRARHPGVTPDDARKAVNVERHEPVSGEEQRQMTDLTTRITGHQTGLREALTVLGKAAQDTGAAATDVGRLVTVMENLTRHIGPIRGRVDQLEAQVRQMGQQMRNQASPP